MDFSIWLKTIDFRVRLGSSRCSLVPVKIFLIHWVTQSSIHIEAGFDLFIGYFWSTDSCSMILMYRISFCCHHILYYLMTFHVTSSCSSVKKFRINFVLIYHTFCMQFHILFLPNWSLFYQSTPRTNPTPHPQGNYFRYSLHFAWSIFLWFLPRF